MFYDRVRIVVSGGNGGNGCVSFWRRKGHSGKGKPDGGTGGDGGSVYFVCDPTLTTLVDYFYRPEWRAERGAHGSGDTRRGSTGADITVPMPIGTVVIDEETETVIGDLVEPGQILLVAKGGRGGKGNSDWARMGHLHTESQPGHLGQKRRLTLELKVLADVGLVGFPNAGKSSLLTRISDAHPKIASYPFTTLRPILGRVEPEGSEPFTVADIPGLIEGASTGHGLGLRFLRHVERTRVLAHVIDLDAPEPRTPASDIKATNAELAAYSAELAIKPQLIVANKADLPGVKGRLTTLKSYCTRHKLPLLIVSAETGEGVPELITRFSEMLGRK
jgi:GTP-binding protein